MKVFNNIFKLITFPIYYLVHNNYFFGFIQKFVIGNFKYKKFQFKINNLELPLGYYSSFLWNTYELNDRVMIEKNLNKSNKCIIIGGGIGFIAVIAYWKTKNKILVFEINPNIINLLKNNLKINKVKFTVYSKNLTITSKIKNKKYNTSNNFLANSLYRKTNKKINFKNLFYRQIRDFNKFNTLIIDGEGIEDYFIKNIKKINNIHHLFFEFHNDIFSEEKKNQLFNILKINKFYLKDKFINTYYFCKND